MKEVFIGIGSNLGNRRENIQKALDYLRNIEGIYIEKISSLIETEPQDSEGPNFLNGVVKIKTEISPHQLLGILQDIEIKLGRASKGDKRPRPIDLDILIYDHQKVNTPHLKIPHPQILKRDFVMKPLLEIEPQTAFKYQELFSL